MEQKILAFMKENGIAVFAEADRATGAMLFQIPQTQPAQCVVLIDFTG